MPNLNPTHLEQHHFGEPARMSGKQARNFLRAPHR
jgi:hypothetical protein